MTLQEAFDKSDKSPAEAKGIRWDLQTRITLNLTQVDSTSARGNCTINNRAGLFEVATRPLDAFREYDFEPVMNKQ